MNNYAAHQNLVKSFMLAFQKAFPHGRIFQRHVGLFYTVKKTPVRINQPGMADLWALIPHEGKCFHFEFEIKTGSGRQSKEQKNWENTVKKLNAHYLIVRDVETAVKNLVSILGEPI